MGCHVTHKSRVTAPPIIAQIKAIRQKENWLAFIIGGTFGAFVPVAVFALNQHLHREMSLVQVVLAHEIEDMLVLLLIAAGAVFSAKSVYGWGLSLFAGDLWKAAGYCVLIEGVMVISPIDWLRMLAMIVLVAINVIATGANLMELPSSIPEPTTTTSLAVIQPGPADSVAYILGQLSSGRTKKEVAVELGITIRHLNRLISQ